MSHWQIGMLSVSDYSENSLFTPEVFLCVDWILLVKLRYARITIFVGQKWSISDRMIDVLQTISPDYAVLPEFWQSDKGSSQGVGFTYFVEGIGQSESTRVVKEFFRLTADHLDEVIVSDIAAMVPVPRIVGFQLLETW